MFKRRFLAALLAIAVAGPAFAATDDSTTAGIEARTTLLLAAVSDGDESVPVAAVGTPAVAAFSPLRTAADVRVLPVSILGHAGGSELLGGAVAVALGLRYVRRRRLI